MSDAESIRTALFAAMTKAGESPEGTIVETYTDTSDGYYDYWGYRVDGPHRERAAQWVRTYLERQGKRQRHQSGDWSMRPVYRGIDIRPIRVSWAGRVGTEDLGLLVCTGSAGLGD